MGHRGDLQPPYHVVANLISFAATNWAELDGVLLLRGIDLWELPADRALSVLWAVALENRDEKGRAQMLARLEQLTPRQMERAKADMFYRVDDDAAMFAAAERGLSSLMG